MSFHIGDLVKSETSFSGIGKLISFNESTDEGIVAFFESPLKPEVRPVQILTSDIYLAELFDERVIYCIDKRYGTWRRARYGGAREDGHLVIYNRDDQTVLPLNEIYVLNLKKGIYPNPLEFLLGKANDTPFFSEIRLPFIRAYIRQRATCRSISSIPSSSVDLEPHQLAVIRRVLQDDHKKYLLGDEVGLGKTIEAGLIVREHILEKGEKARIVIICPSVLVNQWRQELASKFHLEELLDRAESNTAFLIVSSFEDFEKNHQSSEVATMFVVDEVHQIAPMAWSETLAQRKAFSQIASWCQSAEVALLLSGTPQRGNEKNYLAMLHCLDPASFSLSENGVANYKGLVNEREVLGGIYSALTPGNIDLFLSEICIELQEMLPADEVLKQLLKRLSSSINQKANIETSVRTESINAVRNYIGNNYRIFHRLLRNRREDEHIKVLFPGLDGLDRVRWQFNQGENKLDDLLEVYRDFSYEQPDKYAFFGNYLEWLDLYFCSPQCVAWKTDELLKMNCLGQEECDLISEIKWVAELEQKQKDSAFLGFMNTWFNSSSDAKAVVFCTDERIATRAFNLLISEFGSTVLLNDPAGSIQFTDKSPERILVLDSRGEDGLNLHGRNRLAFHYSVIRSLTQIEQRNGRLNRYSANVVGAKPIGSATLVPSTGGILSDWVSQLDDTVKIFDETVASLQFVLERHFGEMWQKTKYGEYEEVFQSSAEKLGGSQGLLQKERIAVRNQEHLDAMECEVEEASVFADEIAQADDVAVEQAERLAKWIKDGLHFKQDGCLNNAFRFQFRYADAGKRTLLDVESILSHCLMGMDMESDYQRPSTHLMSANRSYATEHGFMYPFRFGQPFVDAIYHYTLLDSRGISSVRLRVDKALKDNSVELSFRLTWLIESTSPDQKRSVRVIGDDWFKPRFMTTWVNELGVKVDDDCLKILNAPYDKRGNSHYQDINIDAAKWKFISGWGDTYKWSQVLQKTAEISRSMVEEAVEKAWPGPCPKTDIDISSPRIQLVGVDAVFLSSQSWFLSQVKRLTANKARE